MAASRVSGDHHVRIDPVRGSVETRRHRTVAVVGTSEPVRNQGGRGEEEGVLRASPQQRRPRTISIILDKSARAYSLRVGPFRRASSGKYELYGIYSRVMN